MRQIILIVSLLLGLTVAGTIGFRVAAGLPWIECTYMAVITLTTVGSRDVELSQGGMLFVIVYLICGLSIFTYSMFYLGQWVINARLRSLLEKRRMEKTISKLRNHFIVCGQGRMGTTICEHLHGRNKSFVIIDVDDERLGQTCVERDWMYLVGDATDDEVLKKAGIERAKSLASVLPTDADNVYVVLSARILASHLQIVARAGDEKAIEKMQRAGATRIVSPFSSGAVKMARFMLNPSVEDFLEIADSHGNKLELADVQITDESPYAGKQLKETDLRDKGVMVIGIRRANGDHLIPPPGTATILPGDCLFAFGSAHAVNDMTGEDNFS